jgi:hypothetical protein
MGLKCQGVGDKREERERIRGITRITPKASTLVRALQNEALGTIAGVCLM